MLLLEFLNVPVELGFSEPYIILPLWAVMLGILIGVPAAFFGCVFFKVFIYEPMELEMGPTWERWMDAHVPYGPWRQTSPGFKVRNRIPGIKWWIWLPVVWCGLMSWMVMALVFNTIRYRSTAMGFMVWAELLRKEFPHNPLPDIS